MMSSNLRGDYELYAVNDGFIKVTSGTQRKILHLLQSGDLTPSTIAKRINLSKSTITPYLYEMEREGLIRSKIDVNDRRSKIYSLVADPIVNSKKNDVDALNLSTTILSEIAIEPKRASNLILRSLILTADGVGMDIAPMMFTIGCDVGKFILPDVKSQNVNFMLNVIKRYFDEFDIGEFIVYTRDPITILFRDTVDLTQSSAEILASFVSGLMVTVLHGKTGIEHRIFDKEVFGIRNNYIRMTFVPVEENKE